MIRKRGLQDVKRRNRQVIIQTILENDGLSRVEIAQRTELSPSTVSTLVAELIGEGILTESGSHTTTAGRSRTGLTINAGFGAVAVVEEDGVKFVGNAWMILPGAAQPAETFQIAVVLDDHFQPYLIGLDGCLIYHIC